MRVRRIKDALFFGWKYKNWRRVLAEFQRGAVSRELILRNGVTWRTYDANPILALVYEIYFRREYTPAGWSIGRDDLVVDIGANVGVFTVLAAERTRNKVYAFEPHPENFKYLRENIALNGLTNVVAHEAGVTDVSGTQMLGLSGTGGWHSIAANLEQSVSVRSMTLAEIIDRHAIERIDFLKLDCEGSEGAILSSLAPEDWGRIKKIALEFHDWYSSLKHDQICALLARNGFETRLKWDGVSHIGMIFGRRV